jgi:hypothetical protein
MTDETFFERLRHDASQLQFTVDDVTAVRLAARVRARVGAQPTLSQMLAGWLRPLAAAVAAVTLAATLSLSWIDSTPDTGAAVDQIAANTTEISVDGMTLASE